MMRRLPLVAALVAVAVLAAACSSDRSEKPARGVYVGGGAGVSAPN